MDSLGIVRDVDKLGRIVVPIEFRNKLGIGSGDPVEIFAESDKIIIRRYSASCVFCKSEENTTTFMGKTVCEKCLRQLREDK